MTKKVEIYFRDLMNAESLKPSSKSVPEAREETTHPAGPIPASLRFESDTLSFKLGEQRRHE